MEDREQTKYQGFTLSLALVDALPVLFFGISAVLVGLLFRSTLFVIGAAMIFFAGFFKVLWKIILAVSGKDIPLLNKQMRVVMPAGWLLAVISLILGRKRIDFSAIWSAVSGFPACLFFLLGLCGMAVMGVLAKKLDSTKVRSNWIEQCVNGFAQLCILLGLVSLL